MPISTTRFMRSCRSRRETMMRPCHSPKRALADIPTANSPVDCIGCYVSVSSTRETRRPRCSTWRRRAGIVEHGDRHSATVELTAFDLALRFQPLDVVLGQVHQLRKRVVGTGDPHLLGLLRLYIARCEARRNGLVEARRHHELVSALLERYENVWLEGLLALDRSVVAVLLGDVDAALTCAELALNRSLRSGHSQTGAAATSTSLTFLNVVAI